MTIDETTKVTFEVTDDRYPFVGVSRRGDCRVTLERVLPTDDEVCLLLFEATGIGSRRLTTLLDREYDFAFEVVGRGDTRNHVLLTVEEPSTCPMATLCEEGAIWQSARADGGTGEIVALVPAPDVGDVLETVAAEHPSVELRNKRTEWEPDFTFRDRASRVVEQRLTDRQSEVLEAAVVNGYFEHPRDVTGTDLAAQMDISQTTFSEHLRAAQSKIFTDLLELNARPGHVS